MPSIKVFFYYIHIVFSRMSYSEKPNSSVLTLYYNTVSTKLKHFLMRKVQISRRVSALVQTLSICVIASQSLNCKLQSCNCFIVSQSLNWKLQSCNCFIASQSLNWKPQSCNCFIDSLSLNWKPQSCNCFIASQSMNWKLQSCS